MQSIPMVDLQGQYKKIQPEVDAAFREVLESCHFINGKWVKTFAENLATYLNIAHVIPCANGTDALQIALMALDLQPGDEVITTPFTFIATAEVIALLRLKPVFVDAEYDTFNIDVSKIEAAITSKTKCIIPVHLFGQAANMEAIMAIANAHNIYVVEDNAQAIGADYHFSNGTTQKVGTIGHIGCTSFFPSKNLGCYGDGGAIFTNDAELADTIRMVINHGSRIKYYHEVVGVNSRLDSLQAAVLDIKLKHLDTYANARRSAADIYDTLFKETPNLECPYRAPYSSHVFHQYTLKVEAEDRDRVMAHLKRQNIACAVYYPVPLHIQNAYKMYGHKEGDFPISEKLAKEVFSLPIHTELDTETQKRIAQEVKTALS